MRTFFRVLIKSFFKMTLKSMKIEVFGSFRASKQGSESLVSGGSTHGENS